MNKNFFQSSIKDSLFTGLIALALFGPIVGLRIVAVNEALVVQPKWLVVALIVAFCAINSRFTACKINKNKYIPNGFSRETNLSTLKW